MKLLIADDHPLILRALASVAAGAPEEIETTMVATLADLRIALQQGVPDVLLLDVRLGADDARTFLPRLLRTYPRLQVIAVSSMDDVATVKMLMTQGVRGYVLKSDKEEELLTAIRAVLRGETFLSAELNALAARQALLPTCNEHLPLTPREEEVLRLIVDEFSTKQIADHLCISDKTVENHRSNLFLKFDVKNVAGLVRKAVLKGYTG